MIPVLKLEGVSRRFGGNEVLRDLDLSLNSGERVAIIGPNGAGKSTVFNLVSGQLPVSSGRIWLDGSDITAASPQHRVRLGIGRSFQLTCLLTGLSVQENMLVALHGRRGSRFQPSRGSIAYPSLMARAEELLHSVDLWNQRGEYASQLSYGEQKKLEVAMTLALEPRLLLLDEQTAGLSAGEVHSFMQQIRTLVTDTTLLFTEHDMDVVFGLAGRIVVLYYGHIIAAGRPEEIRADPQVREIYLGAQEGLGDGA